jgi:hypothetical protein
VIQLQTFVLLCVRNVFVSDEAYSLLSFLRNASVMHPNHMSDYIYCVYVSKMHRKSFFYEVTTHLILFFEQTFPLKSLLFKSNCSLLFIRGVHINILANA